MQILWDGSALSEAVADQLSAGADNGQTSVSESDIFIANENTERDLCTL